MMASPRETPMQAIDREFIDPTDEAHWLSLRTRDVTSTEISALYGESPYMTKAELWYAKKDGLQSAIAENTRMTWGKRLQDAIANGIATENEWTIFPFKEYCRVPSLRIGSSFDFRGVREQANGDGAFILEIKNVDGLAFRNGWGETDFGLEAPAHIELQVQHQMHVSDYKYAVIGALIGGNRLELLEREYYPDTGASIDKQVAAFWASIDANQPPPLDFERDMELIVRLAQEVSKGKVMEATDRINELALIYNQAAELIKLNKEEQDIAKAELLTLIGDAEQVLGSNYKISAPTVHRKEYSVAACDYRRMTVNFKKPKE